MVLCLFQNTKKNKVITTSVITLDLKAFKTKSNLSWGLSNLCCEFWLTVLVWFVFSYLHAYLSSSFIIFLLWLVRCWSICNCELEFIATDSMVEILKLKHKLRLVVGVCYNKVPLVVKNKDKTTATCVRWKKNILKKNKKTCNSKSCTCSSHAV